MPFHCLSLEECLIKQILDDLVAEGNGIQAAIFLDGEGETIVQSGERNVDVQLIGAWKEIQLDRIKDISKRLKFGEVRAVLFLLDQGKELVVPVVDEYCLVLLLSITADFRDSLNRVRNAVELLKKDIS
jgi:predicted regulator of Ras-like GTPase activity (Roadblock/LC7/MglB family)